jgi:hypothetical protein
MDAAITASRESDTAGIESPAPPYYSMADIWVGIII